MRGYSSSPYQQDGVLKHVRGNAHARTYLSFRGMSLEYGYLQPLLHIHPADVVALDIRPTETWALVPWSPWPGVTEEERLAREGTVAFVEPMILQPRQGS